MNDEHTSAPEMLAAQCHDGLRLRRCCGDLQRLLACRAFRNRAWSQKVAPTCAVWMLLCAHTGALRRESFPRSVLVDERGWKETTR